eukprot:106407-Prymnesium_polylepis.3
MPLRLQAVAQTPLRSDSGSARLCHVYSERTIGLRVYSASVASSTLRSVDATAFPLALQAAWDSAVATRSEETRLSLGVRTHEHDGVPTP